MCIRDRLSSLPQAISGSGTGMTLWLVSMAVFIAGSLLGSLNYICLLYTSDAADERSSVDLGGRRIIKKKKKREISTVMRDVGTTTSV